MLEMDREGVKPCWRLRRQFLISQKNKITRRWARRGARPSASNPDMLYAMGDTIARWMGRCSWKARPVLLPLAPKRPDG
jgi:hypothetical protein